MPKRDPLAHRGPDGHVVKRKSEPSVVLGEFRRQAEAAKLVARNPLLGTHLGWMRETHVITAAQHDAGLRMAEVFGRYDRAMGTRRTEASPGYEIGREHGVQEVPLCQTPAKRRQGCTCEVCEEARHSHDAKAVETYTRLMAHLKGFGPRIVRSITDLCVMDKRDFEYGDLPYIIGGLSAIAEHFGLTGRGAGRRQMHAGSPSGRSARPRSKMPVLEPRPATDPTGRKPLPQSIDTMLATLAPDMDAALKADLRRCAANAEAEFRKTALAMIDRAKEQKRQERRADKERVTE